MRRATNDGFTLLEVILAVTIFGIVATAIYGTFSRTLRSKAIAEGRIDVVRTGRTAVNRIADELTTATILAQFTGEKKFQSIPGGSEGAPLDSLYFWTLASRGGPESLATDQRVVEYFFADAARSRRAGTRTVVTGANAVSRAGEPAVGVRDADTVRVPGRDDDEEAFDLFASFGADALRERGIPTERLLRREGLLLARDPLADAFTTVFLDNVASLQFRFCDGVEWQDAWDSDDRQTYRTPLPLAVAVDLGLYDETGAVHHFGTAVDLVFAPRRDSENVCPPWEERMGARHP